MATTTNFGWETPDDTDLVKDGAAAIRTLGSAIDTSLVDLKGGTTGQVLSKTSNTDMDFTWVTSDDANAIQNAIVDAKGDLIAASAADTPARLAVGNNGETLVADSSASTGLRWQPTGSTNYVINGLFDIWQRGTSSTTSGAYATADRWVQGVFSGSGTFAQTTAALATGTQFSMRFTASATAQPYIVSVIETQNALTLAGRQVTLSGFLATSDSSSAILKLEYTTSTDSAWNASYTAITPDSGSESAATTTTLSRRSVTYTIPASARTLRVQATTVNTIANTATFTIGGIQLELGAVPTALRRSGGTLAGELAACQRYYYRINAGSSWAPFGNGMAFSTTGALHYIQFPVTMRIRPTALEQSGTASNYSTTRNTTATDALTAVPVFSASTVAGARVESASANLVAGNATFLNDNNSTAAYLGWSAEL